LCCYQRQLEAKSDGDLAENDIAATTSPTDFTIEFYKAHRSHEGVLNTATANYEQSLLRLILIFNAACIGGLVTLMQTRGALTYNFAHAIWAVYVWFVGVGAVFLSTVLAYESQKRFTKAFRYRRMAIEMLKDNSKVGDISNQQIFGWPDNVDAQKCCDDATKYRETAGRLQTIAMAIGLIAVVSSVVGFALAVTSIAPSSTAMTNTDR
jgi:hypothetical protein